MLLSEWLDRYAIRLLIQPIKRGQRPKNRAVLEYRSISGESSAVGGRTVREAVLKADILRRRPSHTKMAS